MHEKKNNDHLIKKLTEDEQERDEPGSDVQEGTAAGFEDKLKLSYPPNGQLEGADATNFSNALKKAHALASLGYSKEQIVNVLFGESSANSQTDKPSSHSVSEKLKTSPKKVTTKQETDTQSNQHQSLTGKTFGKYQILDLIGKGGMSTVYKTENLETRRIVACKVLLPRLLDDKKNRRRFEHEAEAAQRLTHNNIINVHDFGETDGQPFMIMDYLDGISLSDLIDSSGKLPIRRALPIFLQICDALTFAHKRDIVHRDLKPSNIMLSGREDSPHFTKVVDFGIAKIIKEHTEESTKLTKSGEIFGSPLYMSPEQCMGQSVDCRTDIYSFGILMYEVIKGKPPLEGPDPLSTMFKQMNDKPEDLGDIDSDARLVQSMENIIFKCMNKSPAARYQNMESVRTDLEHAIAIGDSGFNTLAKVSRVFAGFQRTASHELTTAAKSQRKLLLLTTSTSLVLLPIIGMIFLLWPLRYAWGAVPDAKERQLDLEPIVLEPDKAASLSKIDSTTGNGPLSPSTLSDLVDISDLEPTLAKGNQYFKAGLYKEAMPFYRAAQAICRANKMEDSTEIFEANLFWAECLLRTQVYSPARDLATEALGRLSKVGKGDNSDGLVVSGILADAYYADGRYDDALQSYNEFLARLTPLNLIQCKKPVELAYSLSTAGRFYQDRRDLSKANQVSKTADSLWQQLAQQMPTNATVKYDWGVTENNLGLVEESLKDYPAAHDKFRKSASNLAKTKGENSLDWAKVQLNDSDALWKLSQWYGALEQRSRAKKIWSHYYQGKTS